MDNVNPAYRNRDAGPIRPSQKQNKLPDGPTTKKSEGVYKEFKAAFKLLQDVKENIPGHYRIGRDVNTGTLVVVGKGLDTEDLTVDFVDLTGEGESYNDIHNKVNAFIKKAPDYDPNNPDTWITKKTHDLIQDVLNETEEGV